MIGWTLEQKIIETPRLLLHHICADDLITLYEEPGNLAIYEGKPYSNPYRQLMDEIDGPENIYEISCEEFLEKFARAEIRADDRT